MRDGPPGERSAADGNGKHTLQFDSALASIRRTSDLKVSSSVRGKAAQQPVQYARQTIGNLAAEAMAFVGQLEAHDARVLRAARPPHEPLGFQAIEHPRHRSGIDTGDARKFSRGVPEAEVDREQTVPTGRR